MTMSPPMRAVMGFLAAVLSVLTFHQGLLGVLHLAAIPGFEIARAPYQLNPIPPFGVPSLVNLCFWGGLYGALFGLVAPKVPLPMWVTGILTGVFASLVGFFIVAAIKGNPIGGGWVPMTWVRSFVINGTFGLGVGIIFPMLAPRALARA
jgi:hypothetical protein